MRNCPLFVWPRQFYNKRVIGGSFSSGVFRLKILVIGRGGREHALCWKLKQSPRATAGFCAPGNAGTALDVQNVAIEPGDQRGLVQFARKEGIGLTVVGPEEPL